MTIDFTYAVVCGAPLAARGSLARKLRVSPFHSALVSAFGFDVRVRSGARPANDAHVIHGFETARSLAMITDGTLYDMVTGLLFSTQDLERIDSASPDAHVRCVVKNHGAALHAASLGMSKYGIAEMRIVLGRIDDEAAERATKILEAACAGIVSGVFPQEGALEIVGESWRIDSGGGILLLEPTSAPIEAIVDAVPTPRSSCTRQLTGYDVRRTAR